MFQENTRARQPAHVPAILVVGGVALFSSQVGISPWALGFFCAAIICGLLGYICAPRQTLVIDEAGIRWGPVGKPATVFLPGSRIRLVRSAEGDRLMQIGTSGPQLWSIPAYFLRSAEQQSAFLFAIKRLAPDTALEGFPQSVFSPAELHPAEPSGLF